MVIVTIPTFSIEMFKPRPNKYAQSLLNLLFIGCFFSALHTPDSKGVLVMTLNPGERKDNTCPQASALYAF